MVQYPYFLYCKQPQAEGTTNLEGDFVEGLPSPWEFIGECRDEVNTKGETVTQINGENVQISAVIYAPKGTKTLPHNSKVIVTEKKVNECKLDNDDWISEGISSGIIRINDSVKGFSKTRLNVRLWV